MKNFIYIFSVLLCFFSCKKKEEEKHTVIYKIIVTSGQPTYSLSYSSSNNTTKSESSIKYNWTSPQIDDREAGSSVFLTLNGGNGGTYKMYIYIDGYLEKEDSMGDPYGPRTITAEIPED